MLRVFSLQFFLLSFFSLGRLECTPILFAMPPKTASVYIPQYFAKGLDKLFMLTVSVNGGFPDQKISPNKMKKILTLDMVSRGHFDSSSENLDLVRNAGGHIVVSVRDLRQNVVSWTFHESNLISQGQGKEIFHLQAPHPRGYTAWSFAKRLDWNIDRFIPLAVQWIEGWLAAAEKEPSMIKFVTYENFVNHPNEYFSEILEFLGYSDDDFKEVNLRPTKQLHYRKGETNEWERILTKEQIARIEEQIPSYFFDLFGWN